MEARKKLIALLCVVVCAQQLVASEKKKTPEPESGETASDQNVVQENQVAASPFGSLLGRSRIGASFSFRSGNTQQAGYGMTVISGAENLALGFGYSYWLREDLTLNVSMSFLAPEVGVRAGPVSFNTNGVVAVLAGIRWYVPSMASPTVKPYLMGSIGPYVGSGVEVRSFTTSRVTEVSPGGYAGAGLDIQLHRDFMLGLRGGYNFVSDFSQPVAGRDNFSGFQIGVEVSWIFGEGKSPDG